MTFVELCAGTAAVSLRALAGHPVDPLTGFMGGKRRWAGELAELLGVHRYRPDRVVLVDAGPWGEVWDLLREREARQAVAATLDAWDREVASDRPALVTALWLRLAEHPPADDPCERVAQYLWLQARSAGSIPVWWSGERWESPSGSRTGASALAPRGSRENGPAHARLEDDRALGAAHPKAPLSRRRGACGEGPAYPASSRSTRGGRAVPKGVPTVERAHERGVGRQKQPGCRGVMAPATIARRIRALDAIDWSRVEVRRCSVQDVDPIPGATVYFDPPYQGAPRYAVLFPRAEVLDVSRRWAAAGCRVAVSEGEPLPLDGWASSALPRSAREYVTTSWGARLAEQGSLPLRVGPERLL